LVFTNVLPLDKGGHVGNSERDHPRSGMNTMPFSLSFRRIGEGLAGLSSSRSAIPAMRLPSPPSAATARR
jgi:hypothetical protein